MNNDDLDIDAPWGMAPEEFDPYPMLAFGAYDPEPSAPGPPPQSKSQLKWSREQHKLDEDAWDFLLDSGIDFKRRRFGARATMVVHCLNRKPHSLAVVYATPQGLVFVPSEIVRWPRDVPAERLKWREALASGLAEEETERASALR